MRPISTLFDSIRLPRASVEDVAAWLIAFADGTNVFILVLFAVFVRQVGLQLHADLHWKGAAKYAASLLLLGYIVHLSRTVDIRHDVLGVVLMLTRASLIAYLFFLLFAAPVVYFAHLIVRYVQIEWNRLVEFVEKLTERHRHNRESRRRMPAPVLESRELLVQRSAAKARLDYDFECQLLRSSDLGEDELEFALMAAKQKYLDRLQQVLR